MLVSFKKVLYNKQLTKERKGEEIMKKNKIDIADLVFCGFFTLIGLIVLGVGLIMIYSTVISDSNDHFYPFLLVSGIIISFSAAICVIQWGWKAIGSYRSLTKN